MKALALRRSEILQERPEWGSAAPEPAALKRDVDVRRSEREGWQQSARQVWQQAEERRAEAQAKVAEAQQRQAANDTALSEVQRRLAALQTDGKTLAARQVELAGHRRACESAEEEIRSVDEEIGRLPADALQRAEELRRQISQNEKDASAAREDRRQAEADARALRAQAPYSSLVLAEERVDQLVADERAELARLNAIQLLFQAVSDAKATVLEGLAGPVAASANLILERIVGGPLPRSNSRTTVSFTHSGRKALTTRRRSGKCRAGSRSKSGSLPAWLSPTYSCAASRKRLSWTMFSRRQIPRASAASSICSKSELAVCSSLS
jgi:hypothetical protein